MARLILGIQPAREAIRARGEALEKVLVQQDGGPTLDALARFATGRGVAVETRSRGELDRMAAGGRHQGVIVVAPELELVPLEKLPIGPTSLFMVLDGVMDPQNFGAVIRSAVALGASAIVWPEHSSAPLSPATFRASAGAVEHAALCRVPSLPEALDLLAEKGVTAVALDAQGPTLLSGVDLRGPIAIVIGAEDKGVRRPVRRACRFTARLPMAGPIASLNASVAAALALYEAARQRTAEPPRATPGAQP
ncbi:MAG: 23S rRNA (guanosine(2251)-2'-O)-methyltransferase RlmB [Byssovorax sp.]